MPRAELSMEARRETLRRVFPSWRPRTLDQMLASTAKLYGDRPFVITNERSYSYAELDHWASRLAHGLINAGVMPGDHVALVMANYPEFVALKFAISRAGAIAVPVNFLNRTAELGYVLEQSDANVLITMDRYRDLDYPQMLDELAPGWEVHGGGHRLPKLRGVYLFATSDEPVRVDASPLDVLLGDETASGTWPSRDPDAVSDIIYTSGTTGGPKGVLLTHDMLLRSAFGSAWGRAFEDGRRLVFAMPMYHVFGYVEGLLSVMFVGGSIVPQLKFDPRQTLHDIAAHRVNDVLGIPTMTWAILDKVDETEADLSSVTAVFSSGARSPVGIWERIFATFGPVEVSTGYGMSEATASTTLVVSDHVNDRLTRTNGRLRDVGIAGDPELDGMLVDYRVVDTATEEVLPPGEVGELRMRGPGVTSGYYNKPDATAAAMDAQGWMRTGDLGVIDTESYLMLRGRTKESYRCGGEQVLPVEVEDVLASHEFVDQAFVVPVEDRKMGEVGAAFIITRGERQPTPEELIDFCASRLARFKVPRHVFFLQPAELPTTVTGRPRKFLLAERAGRLVSG